MGGKVITKLENTGYLLCFIHITRLSIYYPKFLYFENLIRLVVSFSIANIRVVLGGCPWHCHSFGSKLEIPRFKIPPWNNNRYKFYTRQRIMHLGRSMVNSYIWLEKTYRSDGDLHHSKKKKIKNLVCATGLDRMTSIRIIRGNLLYREIRVTGRHIYRRLFCFTIPV